MLGCDGRNGVAGDNGAPVSRGVKAEQVAGRGRGGGRAGGLWAAPGRWWPWARLAACSLATRRLRNPRPAGKGSWLHMATATSTLCVLVNY